MPFEVQVKEVPAQHVAAVTRRASLATIGQAFGQAMEELWGELGPKGVQVAGPPFLVMPEVIDEDTEGDIELCVPVSERFEGQGSVYGREVEAITAASTVHRGPYDQVGPAYHTLFGWVQEHGHEVAGPPREVYLTEPTETMDPADYLTEVLVPIR